MFRPAFRATLGASRLSRAGPRAAAARRFASTDSAQKSRSWKNSAARWALAGGLVYYYNTAPVFAEEPACTYDLKTDHRSGAKDRPDSVHAPPETARENEQYDSIASISEQRKAQSRSQLPSASAEPASQSVQTAADGEATAAGSPGALEEEADQQGAFNEETGEINWDCPCLGGMAYGPCGEQFRAAFSCFVFSKEEPKGVDCIDNFKAMQNCFREHPDVYGGELEDDEEGATVEQEEGRPVSVGGDPAPQAARIEAQAAQSESGLASGADPTAREDVKARVQAATEQVRREEPQAESDKVVPKAWHDTRSANEKE